MHIIGIHYDYYVYLFRFSESAQFGFHGVSKLCHIKDVCLLYT